MGWVIYYAVLTTAYLGAWIYSLVHPHRFPEIIKSASVAITLASALGQAIARVNLRFYLFWQRFWVWWNGDKTAIWRVALRLDGDIGRNAVTRVTNALTSELEKWDPEVISASDLEARVKFERIVQLHFMLEPSEMSADGMDHFLIRSEEMEVAYGRARHKIDRQIAPLLSGFINLFHPDNYSITFEVLFPDSNPFFAFYVAHLRPEQVTQFQLVFKPKDFSRTDAEKIVVTRNALEVTAVTTEAFAELAKAFVLLSADAVRVAQGT